MARQLRFPLPGIPQHIVHRGNDRQVCFFQDRDRHAYLHLLGKAASDAECEVHAFVLMTNHVHLLVTPGIAYGVPTMMQRLGQRYVQRVNARYGRTGTLWEGRYKATVVASDDYLLRCYRYIELNPVRAHLSRSPADYRWSSYQHNALGRAHPLITPHEIYQSLGKSPRSRQHAYQALVQVALNQGQITQIREATRRAWPLGDTEFSTRVEGLLDRRISRNSWGGNRRSNGGYD